LGHADSAGERASDESRRRAAQTAGAQPREHELAQLAENELRYAMLARIANGQIRTLQTAIREGRTQ